MPHLPEAVESVLGQSHRDLELLVIDDGSHDGSGPYLDSLADPRVTVVHQPNAGLVESLNRGLARSKHELIARMDADDVSHPQRLARQLAALATDPGAVAVACCYTIVDEAGRPVSEQHVPLSASYTERQLYFRDAWAHGSILMRRTAVIEAGGYRDVGPCEDYDLWLRLLERGSLVGLCAQPLFTYRMTGSGVSLTASERQDQCRRTVRDAAHDRRPVRLPSARRLAQQGHEHVATARDTCRAPATSYAFDHLALGVVLWRRGRRGAAMRCAAGTALMALRHPSVLAVLPPVARAMRPLRRRPLTAEEIRLAGGRR
jgi:glycosyltransferase involved in cell wall biosynthesis